MIETNSNLPTDEGRQEQLLRYTLLGDYQKRMADLLPSFSEELSATEANIPFLSVILRTQGKRYEMLKEALLCLEAQTDDSFEVILIIHNASEEGKASVARLLDTLDPTFRKKIRAEILDGGTRTAPLNRGASLACGTHFAMLDDDDLLFDHWIENFHTAAKKEPKKVIRCYGCTQAWRSVSTPEGLRLISNGTIKNQYCAPFSLLAHLEDNYTPISCVAIPTFCYRRLGIAFDEALTTAEDWDYIMRCILTVGVVDTEEITFLYRLWDSEGSRSLHTQKEWHRNRSSICKKLDQIPLLTDRRTLLQELQTLPMSQTKAASWEKHMTPYSIKMTCKQILRTVKKFLQCRLNVKKHTAIIRQSKFFDEKWYVETYPEIMVYQLEPARHYLIYGWRERKDPSPTFSTKEYLEYNPEVREADVCPLLHYEQILLKEKNAK